AALPHGRTLRVLLHAFLPHGPLHHRTLPTFPPRRSSDLHTLSGAPAKPDLHALKYVPSAGAEAGFWWGEVLTDQRPADAYSLVRSEEHTSELQSRFDLVCRLLLEKRKICGPTAWCPLKLA